MSYVMASVQRSGSTWLCSLLEGTQVAGRPVVEYWNLGVEWAAHQDRAFRTYQDYLAHVRTNSTTANGVCGVNIMWRQMPGALARLRGVAGWEDLDDLQLWHRAIPDLTHFIFTYRSDVLGQAISWAIAHQTRQFTSTDPRQGEPEFDFWLIDTYYWDIQAHNLAWRSWFARFGIEPLLVCYEDVLADPTGSVMSALEFLGLDPLAGMSQVSNLRRQRSELNDQWRERWQAEAENRHIQPSQYAPM